MSSPKMMTEMEEEDEEMLRRAALKTMARFKDNSSATESTRRLQQNIRTNNANKNNKLYYNNSHRNGSKRSNLIILTKTDTEVSNSQTNSQSNRFTKIVDKTNEVSDKRKRVLPGRFSRLERDDSDDDTDECSDDYSDDNQLTPNSAFSQTHTEESVVVNDSQNLINDSMSDKSDTIEANNDSTNGSINEKVKALTTNSAPTDPINSCNNSDLDRKETIKLNSNNISKTDAFERRKQKFGQTLSQTSTEERVHSSNDSSNPRSQRSSAKNRLSLKSNHKQKNSNKTNERNYHKSVSDKEVVASHRHSHHNSKSDQMDSIDESDDCQHSKKKLRSLVVMK